MGLPTELLDHLVQLTLTNGPRGGFEGIVGSCKLLHEVGKAHAQRYKKLCQFSSMRIGMGSTWPCVFEAIAREPLLGLYVETLDLRACNDQRGCGKEVVQLLLGDDRDRLQEMIGNSRWLALAGVDVQEWKTNVLTDDPNGVNNIYRAVFLLTLLPRLKTLTLTERCSRVQEEGKECKKVLDTLLELDHTASPRADSPLGQLERLCPFEPIEYSSNPLEGFEVADCFMALPSFKELHVSNLIAVEDYHTGIPFQWRLPDYTSNLTCLDLEGCCMKESKSFLRICPTSTPFATRTLPNGTAASSTGMPAHSQQQSPSIAVDASSNWHWY